METINKKISELKKILKKLEKDQQEINKVLEDNKEFELNLKSLNNKYNQDMLEAQYNLFQEEENRKKHSIEHIKKQNGKDISLLLFKPLDLIKNSFQKTQNKLKGLLSSIGKLSLGILMIFSVVCPVLGLVGIAYHATKRNDHTRKINTIKKNISEIRDNFRAQEEKLAQSATINAKQLDELKYKNNQLTVQIIDIKRDIRELELQKKNSSKKVCSKKQLTQKKKEDQEENIL